MPKTQEIIDMPNINKIDAVKVIDNRDDADSSIVLTVHLQGNGGRDGGTFTVVARNLTNSAVLQVNPAPAGYGDVLIGGVAQINGACDALGAAWDGAGGRAAKRDAVLGAALACGLIGAGLAAT